MFLLFFVLTLILTFFFSLFWFLQASNDIAQYVAEIDDMNPLSVIVKEATSNQVIELS